jgi:epoxyqueuosine reductase
MSNKIKEFIQKSAFKLGFFKIGFARAEFLEKEASLLETWLMRGYHGDMLWMENHFDKRLDPRLLLNGCKTVIMFAHNYYPSEKLKLNRFKISKYAYGEDYHNVLKDKLYKIASETTEKFGSFAYKIFIDSAPVMERAWAERSGIGWVGKHSLLLTKSTGSFYFLATMLVDLDLEPDAPVPDHCGNCTKCIDACPTEAILMPKLVDSNKCISYLTIEYRKELPDEYQSKMNGWIFGCDICQDVCPWNRFSTPHSEERFNPSEQLKQVTDDELYQMEKELYNQIFAKSAVKRTKFQGLRRNIDFIEDEDRKQKSRPDGRLPSL